LRLNKEFQERFVEFFTGVRKDDLVEFETGKFADVEIQKIGCQFPGQGETLKRCLEERPDGIILSPINSDQIAQKIDGRSKH